MRCLFRRYVDTDKLRHFTLRRLKHRYAVMYNTRIIDAMDPKAVFQVK